MGMCFLMVSSVSFGQSVKQSVKSNPVSSSVVNTNLKSASQEDVIIYKLLVKNPKGKLIYSTWIPTMMNQPSVISNEEVKTYVKEVVVCKASVNAKKAVNCGNGSIVKPGETKTMVIPGQFKEGYNVSLTRLTSKDATEQRLKIQLKMNDLRVLQKVENSDGNWIQTPNLTMITLNKVLNDKGQNLKMKLSNGFTIDLKQIES